MQIDADQIKQIIDEAFSRCQLAEMVGGIRHQDVVERNLSTDGYWFDDLTCWWIPVGVSLDAGRA